MKGTLEIFSNSLFFENASQASSKVFIGIDNNTQFIGINSFEQIQVYPHILSNNFSTSFNIKSYSNY